MIAEWKRWAVRTVVVGGAGARVQWMEAVGKGGCGAPGLWVRQPQAVVAGAMEKRGVARAGGREMVDSPDLHTKPG